MKERTVPSKRYCASKQSSPQHLELPVREAVGVPQLCNLTRIWNSGYDSGHSRLLIGGSGLGWDFGAEATRINPDRPVQLSSRWIEIERQNTEGNAYLFGIKGGNPVAAIFTLFGLQRQAKPSP